VGDVTGSASEDWGMVEEPLAGRGEPSMHGLVRICVGGVLRG